MKALVLITLLFFTLNITNALAMTAPKTNVAPIIDGKSSDKGWALAQWQPLNELILGESLNPEDFSGRFKIIWDENKLYLLVEFTDDILFDQHADPLHFYWDDDCIEVFIDEDGSGGNHQFNFNAFAYHVALDNQSVDIGYKNADGSPDFLTLNDHIQNKWLRNKDVPHAVTWEMAIDVYADDFTYQNRKNKKEFTGRPVKLFKGKKLGFMLAYCDNDGSKEREHFIGSTPITAVNGNKNLGYITADVFDTLELIE